MPAFSMTRHEPMFSGTTMEVARRIVGERQALERQLGHAMWAVEDTPPGAFVGQCGLRPVDEGAGPEIDLAYHYTPASWNKGYATEAAIAVIGPGLGPVGLGTIMAVVAPENIGSWRVMEKAGIRYQGLVDFYGMEGVKSTSPRGNGGGGRSPHETRQAERDTWNRHLISRFDALGSTASSTST
jgi:RimJ/RimL family protein N-acetyltransferase